MSGMDRIIKKKKWNSKKISYLSGGIIIISLLVWQIAFADHSLKYKVDREQVFIKEVKRAEFLDFISISGYIQPAKNVFLDAIEGGRVEEILIEEGSLVKKGDKILRLSNTNLHLNIMNQEAKLADQLNTLRSTRLQMEQNSLSLKQKLLNVNYEITTAKRDFENSKRLFEKTYISKEKFILKKENYQLLKEQKKLILKSQKQDSLFTEIQIKQLEQDVKMMENNLDFVRTRLDKLTLTAPISGQLVSLNANLGESIMKGERLGQINVINSYKVNAEISEYYISRVRKNLNGTLDFNKEEYQVKISKIYPKVQNGNFKVDLLFSGKKPKNLRIGQNFRIKLELGQSKEALIIPRGGFYQSTGGQWIFVLNENETEAIKREIQIGKQNPKFYEVLSGLKPGEKILTGSYDSFGEAEKLIFK